jgi:hypothetical protein
MAGAVIEYDSEDPAKNGGILGPMLQPLKDAKYASIFDADGKLIELEGLDEIQAPGQMGFGKGELEAMAKQSAELMPGKDVSPGDSWDAEVKLPLGGLGNDLSLMYTLKLEGIEEIDGKSIARISITGRMKEGDEDVEQGALAVEAKKITGLMLFDIELGQPTEMSTTVELEMALPAGVPVEEGAPGKMPVSSTTVQKLIKVEALPKAETTEEKPTDGSGSEGEAAGDKKAKREARREKRKAQEKAEPEPN